MSSHTSKALVAIVPDLAEPGGTDILDEVLQMDDVSKIGRCLVLEADMDALALIDLAEHYRVEEIVLLGPKHRSGRERGLYARKVQPRQGLGDVMEFVRELWGNLTGSLRLCDYEAALRILYPRPFLVVECEPGVEGCRGLVYEWLRGFCG